MRTGVRHGPIVLLAALAWSFWGGPAGTAALSPVAQCRADDDDVARRPPPAEYRDGAPVVRLSAARQSAAGLELARLAARSIAVEQRGYGSVVDLQRLIEARGAYRRTLAERAVVEAAMTAARRTHDQLQRLYSEQSNVSARQLREARAQLREDEARFAVADRQLEDLRDQVAQAWGPRLAGWATATTSADLDRLVAREDALVLVALDAGVKLGPAQTRAWVAADGDRARAQPAQLVGAAVQVAPGAQGETWYFVTAAEPLRIGMRVDVWLPDPGKETRAVVVPETAVVWTGGRPWVYAQIGEERFVRRPLLRYERLGGDWFVSEGLDPGVAVAVRGGQVLLSEELRWNIPQEDEVD